jgi:hypothetical protein
MRMRCALCASFAAISPLADRGVTTGGSVVYSPSTSPVKAAATGADDHLSARHPDHSGLGGLTPA